MAYNTPNGWIDDDVADAILTLAKLPKDQTVIPKELVAEAMKAKLKLGLIELATR